MFRVVKLLQKPAVPASRSSNGLQNSPKKLGTLKQTLITKIPLPFTLIVLRKTVEVWENRNKEKQNIFRGIYSDQPEKFPAPTPLKFVPVFLDLTKIWEMARKYIPGFLKVTLPYEPACLSVVRVVGHFPIKKSNWSTCFSIAVLSLIVPK